MMEGAFYQQKRTSPTALAVVVLMHGAALTALALHKGEVFTRVKPPPITVDLIDEQKIPPEVPPEPVRTETPPPPSVITHAPPIVPMPPRPLIAQSEPLPPTAPVFPTPGPLPVADGDARLNDCVRVDAPTRKLGTAPVEEVIDNRPGVRPFRGVAQESAGVQQLEPGLVDRRGVVVQ